MVTVDRATPSVQPVLWKGLGSRRLESWSVSANNRSSIALSVGLVTKAAWEDGTNGPGSISRTLEEPKQNRTILTTPEKWTVNSIRKRSSHKSKATKISAKAMRTN